MRTFTLAALFLALTAQGEPSNSKAPDINKLYSSIDETLTGSIEAVNKGVGEAYDRVNNTNYDEVVNNLGDNLERIYKNLDEGGDGRVGNLKDTTLRSTSPTPSSSSSSDFKLLQDPTKAAAKTDSASGTPPEAKKGLAACEGKESVEETALCIDAFFAARRREGQENLLSLLLLLSLQ